jgi:hypothetical protein
MKKPVKLLALGIVLTAVLGLPVSSALAASPTPPTTTPDKKPTPTKQQPPDATQPTVPGATPESDDKAIDRLPSRTTAWSRSGRSTRWPGGARPA